MTPLCPSCRQNLNAESPTCRYANRHVGKPDSGVITERTTMTEPRPGILTELQIKTTRLQLDFEKHRFSVEALAGVAVVLLVANLALTLITLFYVLR